MKFKELFFLLCQISFPNEYADYSESLNDFSTIMSKYPCFLSFRSRVVTYTMICTAIVLENGISRKIKRIHTKKNPSSHLHKMLTMFLSPASSSINIKKLLKHLHRFSTTIVAWCQKQRKIRFRKLPPTLV